MISGRLTQHNLLSPSRSRTAEADELARLAKIRKFLDSNNKELGLGSDTYAMAFRAMHTSTAKRMDLTPEETFSAFYSALTVFSLQAILLGFVFHTIFLKPTF